MRQNTAVDGFRLAYERTGQTGGRPRDFAAAICQL